MKTSTTFQPTASAAAAQRPWWRHGMVWFVISGPALVVVASLITIVIAYRGADTLVVEPPQVRRAATQPTAETPALQARNHAATAAAPR
jgi:hypothetical protein